MTIHNFICPECGSRRVKLSSGAPACYYCALCAYVVRDEHGDPIVTEESLRSWISGEQGNRADFERTPRKEAAKVVFSGGHSLQR